MVSLLNGFVVDLPSAPSLGYLWNFGSLLGLFLVFQVFSGLFLSFHFCNSVDLAFVSIVGVMRDVSWGWLVRVFHANGASFFFLFLYVHVGRGLYYGSYYYSKVWLSGVVILLLCMMVAFLGYVLPWGQMSYWAATVITNLLSVVPYMGSHIVEWVWGGFSVGNPTLVRFYSFHFLFPFVIMGFVMIHLYFLHEVGSGNPLGLSSDSDSVSFHSYYSVKDVFGLFVVMMGMMFVCLVVPYLFMDCENFIFSNPMVTPVHIQPEWYFLFAYAILRSVPSSVGGVVALFMSILILGVFPFMYVHVFSGVSFCFNVKVFYWFLVVDWALLGWLGACEVEYPFYLMSKVFSFFYFGLFLCIWGMFSLYDLIMEWL